MGKSNEGIKLCREIWNSEFWFSEKFTKAQAWIDLLLLADHGDETFYIRGNKVHIKRGQIAKGEIALAVRWKWSREKVRNFLKALESGQQIRQQKSHIITVITINNYEYYQQKWTTEKEENNRMHNKVDNSKLIKNQQLELQKIGLVDNRIDNRVDNREEVPHIYNIYNNNTNKLNSTISTNDLNKTKVLFVDTFPATDEKPINSHTTNQPENPTDSPPLKDDLLELLAEKRKKKLKKTKKQKEKPDPNVKLIHDYFRQRYKEVHEVEYMVQGYAMERKIIKGWLKMYRGDMETIKGIINEFLTDFRFRDDPYWKGGYSIRALQANWNKFAAQWKYYGSENVD